jgi:pyruvyl transferase EpsO
MSTNDVVIECVEQLAASFSRLMPRGRVLALVGFPDHADCGDHAIWLGAKRLLERLGLGPPGAGLAYQCSAGTYDRDEMRAKLGDGTMLFLGGGGPGRATLEFRKRVLKDFPANKAVVLPQLVSELDGETLRQWAGASGHPDLTILAAGRKSEALLTRHLDSSARTALAADAAFLLGSHRRPAKPLYDIVWVARTDEERSDEETESAARLSSQAAEKFELPRFADGVDINLVVKHRPPTILLTDWHSLFFENEQARLAIRRLDFDARSEVYVTRALHLLSLGQVVITDRVHAHIFCLLMNIPHVLIDTASGKNADFHESWTSKSPLCKLAHSPAEAWTLARNAVAKIKSGKNGDGAWSWEHL